MEWWYRRFPTAPVKRPVVGRSKHGNKLPDSIKSRKFLDGETVSFSARTSLHVMSTLYTILSLVVWLINTRIIHVLTEICLRRNACSGTSRFLYEQDKLYLLLDMAHIIHCVCKGWAQCPIVTAGAVTGPPWRQAYTDTTRRFVTSPTCSYWSHLYPFYKYERSGRLPNIIDPHSLARDIRAKTQSLSSFE